MADFEKYYNNPLSLSYQGKKSSFPDKGRSGGVSRDTNNALMDYGATVSLNSIININWDNYPLHTSLFYQNRWELEPVKQKKVSSFPNKEAYVIAILHQNHKVYFSIAPPATQSWTLSLPKGKGATASSLLDKGRIEWGFTPFLIWKNTGNPRIMIQEYFLQNHGLELSVRPPGVKSYNSREVPYLVCYCQIQSGTHDFQSFTGLKVRGFEEGFVEELEFEESLSLF